MTKLPAVFVESIATIIGRWWDRASQVATSAYARGAMKANLLGNLRRGDLSTVPRVYIERMARAGHEPAQEALRLYIAEAVDSHTFQDLPGVVDAVGSAPAQVDDAAAAPLGGAAGVASAYAEPVVSHSRETNGENGQPGRLAK